MDLIFRAVEWESKTNNQKAVELVPLCLEQLFQESIPRWQKQAQRRNLTLDFVLPQKLPRVVSDPTMLERMLTGLMENFTKNLPSGGEIKVKVSTAGDRLKLQFFPEHPCHNNPFKSLGQLLMFQPETGSLSLKLDVTKNLFNALGGKFIVKQRPKNEEVVTIFLPLNDPQSYQLHES
jgi:K+-sensing histidine kinase KdpD